MPNEWLSLSKVATILGVHPSTIRNWSDQGSIPVHRTQGGHRRYLRSEVELWIDAQRTSDGDGLTDIRLAMQSALKNTRLQISEGRLNEEGWYQKLDEEARQQYRSSGRSLLQGLMNFLTSDQDKATAEAEALGYEYASRGRRYGLNSVEATHAFLFFRNVLMESMLAVYEAAAVRSALAWSDMFRKMGDFTDQILITILETYEVYLRANR
jgi:excisionase family DNA binding protein